MEIGIEHDRDIENAFVWLAREAGADLHARLAAAKERFSSAMVPEAGSMLWPDPIALLPPYDLPAGILLQAFALLRDRRYFDSRLAARTLPFFKLIGTALPDLSQVPGAQERARAFVHARNDHPEGTLLELATAARYMHGGFAVRFIPEADRRTPDIALVLIGGEIQVECKRLRPSQYELTEARVARRLFEPACELVAECKAFVHLDVTFQLPLEVVSADYLLDRMRQALSHEEREYAWEDGVARGRIASGDRHALDEDTAESSLLVGPKLFRLFTHSVVPSPRIFMGVRGAGHEFDPRYLHDFEAVALCSWDTESDESIAARARHVRSKLADIDRQLLDCQVGAAHIVVDAERDARAADLRRARIQEQIATFRFDSNLGAITTHYLLTHTAEDRSWTIDETADYASRMERPLLTDWRLFMQGEELGEGPAWQLPTPVHLG
jgi:hypothetical protein